MTISQLQGHWSPKANAGLPRLIFTPDGRGFFEAGDAPVIYSVTHFSYCVQFGNVLTISEAKDVILDDDRKGTHEEPNVNLVGEFEFRIESFPHTGDKLLTFTYVPYAFLFRQFKLISDAIDASYKPDWKLV